MVLALQDALSLSLYIQVLHSRQTRGELEGHQESFNLMSIA